MKKILCVGLMSGTSLDGCDAALVEIDENERFSLKDFVTLPYEEDFKEKLRRNLDDKTARLSEICSLNFELAYKFKEAIDLLLLKSKLKYDDIDFIAGHGQTIWHAPQSSENNVPSTLQIGSGQVLSVLTGVKVIDNFRVADMAAGGQGAPLVPLSEYMCFKDEAKNVILQNIGGIANLTYIPKHAKLGDVIAFDTGPGNVMIDFFMQHCFGKPYDHDGETASSGKIIDSLFRFLQKDDFISKKPPKSTGRERYSLENMLKMISRLDLDQYDKKDIITTITEFTVYGIVYNYRTFIPKFDRVIVSGGGRHNRYIIRRLREELGDIVCRSEDFGINGDAKEAMAFAVLGYLTLNNKPGNVPSATGASRRVILGEISPGTVFGRGEEK